MQATPPIDEDVPEQNGISSALNALMPTSLGGRMALAASVVAATLVIMCIFLISHFVDSTVSRLTTRELTEMARAEGQRVETQISDAMQTAATLDSSIEALIRSGEPDRAEVAEMLFQIVTNEPVLAGAWFGSRPDTFDGRDAIVERDGWLAHPETGHFRPYVYNFGNGAQRHHLSFADAEGAQSDYYRIPLTTGLPYLTNPVPYVIQGQSVLLLSATYPVERDGEAIGVVGVDIDLTALSDRFANIQPYGDGVIRLISHDQMWAATHERTLLGDPVSADADFWPRGLQGSPPAIPDNVQIIEGQNGLLHLLSPVHVRQYDKPWLVVISVPKATVMADARQIQSVLLYTGIGLVISVVIALLIVSHILIRRPVHRSIDTIQALERGQLAVTIPQVRRRDEIGDINRALRSFRDSMRQVRELEAAGRAKSQFLANMSHEIRTPLNGVLAAAQMLDKTDLSSDQAEYLRIIRSSGSMLFDLIRDVLDLSKIESGQIVLSADRFSLADLVQRSADAIFAMAEKKSLDLTVSVNAEADHDYRGDETRICQILTNLAGNAVKFTESGSVSIRVDRNRKTGRVCIEVEDTGRGISPTDLDRVFERFSQVDESDTREFGGSGLGLAISRQFARLMGGDINVSSTLGKGSCFTVLLPLEPIEVSRVRPKGKTGARNMPEQQNLETKPMNVLVVEDVASNRFLLAQFLKSAGHSVIEAENGREALDCLQDQAGIDLILMDLQMPIMSGDVALRSIRASEKHYRDIPVVMVTADADSSTSETLMRAGATACMAKPVDFVSLNQQIAELVDTTLAA